MKMLATSTGLSALAAAAVLGAANLGLWQEPARAAAPPRPSASAWSDPPVRRLAAPVPAPAPLLSRSEPATQAAPATPSKPDLAVGPRPKLQAQARPRKASQARRHRLAEGRRIPVQAFVGNDPGPVAAPPAASPPRTVATGPVADILKGIGVID